MSDTIVTATATEPSFEELRAMLGGETKPAAAAEEPAAAEEETPEKAEAEEPAAEPETASEPVEQKTDSEDELPPGVQKRIAKEAERAAKAQAAIDRAVSERKAKEAEAAKLTTEAKGSEPVKQPQASEGKPKRPQLGEPGHENETWQQFQARESQYEDARDAWLRSETLKEFQAKQQQESAQQAAKARWDEAVKTHGDSFPAKVQSVQAVAPEGLQLAISALDNWSGVAVHLADNPAKLAELTQAFAQNPTKAIATLGRIEAALPSASKPATPEKPLPKPLAKVGGTASASGQDLQDQLEKGSMASFKATVNKIRGGKK
jgi:chemotaxis protein histidine kinase CheA